MSLLAVNEQAEGVACVQLLAGIAVMASVSRRPTPQPLNRRYGTGSAMRADTSGGSWIQRQHYVLAAASSSRRPGPPPERHDV